MHVSGASEINIDLLTRTTTYYDDRRGRWRERETTINQFKKSHSKNSNFVTRDTNVKRQGMNSFIHIEYIRRTIFACEERDPVLRSCDFLPAKYRVLVVVIINSNSTHVAIINAVLKVIGFLRETRNVLLLSR